MSLLKSYLPVGVVSVYVSSSAFVVSVVIDGVIMGIQCFSYGKFNEINGSFSLV